MNKRHFIRLLIPMVFLTGCATSLPDVEPGRSMVEIYNDATGGRELSNSQTKLAKSLRPVHYNDDHPESLTDYTRSVQNEIDNLFAWLPNPTLFLYIPPHVVGPEGLPVTGYTVPFKMYERDHFALPNEVPND